MPADGRVPDPAGAAGRTLARFLPDYMVPAAFVTLTDFRSAPTANRPAGAARAGADAAPTGAGLTAPRTETEAVIAGIWADVLGVDPVGVDDDFLELGGDSVRSLGVAARAKAGSTSLLRHAKC